MFKCVCDMHNAYDTLRICFFFNFFFGVCLFVYGSFCLNNDGEN